MRGPTEQSRNTETLDDGQLVLVNDWDGLRFTAADWHGGQWSAFYALASTGTITEGLATEARACIASLNAWHDDYPNLLAIGELESLLPTDD